MRLALISLLLSLMPGFVFADPVFDRGTVFLDHRVLSDADPSAFDTISYAGIAEREMFDRRSGWAAAHAFLFNVTYSDGSKADLHVNAELGPLSRAEDKARFFAIEIGRLPAVLRAGVHKVWIHDGDEAFSGFDNAILIHTGLAERLVAGRDFLQEMLVHEGVHAALDNAWRDSPEWRAAQQADGRFISPYAREFAMREDLAETFLVWMASRYFPDRLGPDMLAEARAGNAARFAFFDTLNLDMSPYMRAH